MDDEGDPAAPLVRARQRGEPHPPKNTGARAYQRPGPQDGLVWRWEELVRPRSRDLAPRARRL